MNAPTVQEVETVANQLRGKVVYTPTIEYAGAPIAGMENASVFVKMELFQRAGSFKARGALNSIAQLTSPVAGVTAFSAGNHAIAVAYAAKQSGVSAKVVMPRTANAFRVERCKYWGAEIVYGDSLGDLMALVDELQQNESRQLIHPFEGQHITAGTATVGYELCKDVDALDAVVVPVGGGGLISGIASIVKQLQPHCQVFGVEPTEACGMSDSLADGKPLGTVKVNSIADSLSAPMHLPYSFQLIQQNVDDVVKVSDDQLRHAMRFMFAELKLAVEPACAAAMAAIQGPLSKRLNGKRVAIVACGSNIDLSSYQTLIDV